MPVAGTGWKAVRSDMERQTDGLGSGGGPHAGPQVNRPVGARQRGLWLRAETHDHGGSARWYSPKVLERVPVAEGIPAPRQPVVGCKPRPGDPLLAGRGPRETRGLVAAAVTIFLEELPERLVAIHRACGEGRCR